MGKIKIRLFHKAGMWHLAAFLLLSVWLIQGQAGAFSVTVVDHQGNQINRRFPLAPGGGQYQPDHPGFGCLEQHQSGYS